MCSFGSGQSAPQNQFSTQTNTADPRAQAMYQYAWQQAMQASQRPFQNYSLDPKDFAAQLNGTQLGAIGNLQGMQNAGQAYYQAAPQMAYNAGNANAAEMAKSYMSPYLDSVAASTMGWLGQQQGQDRNRLAGQVAANGQWGNDRSGIERAVLAGQQNMATGSTMSNLYNTGYNTALGAAQGDLARQLQASQVLSGQGLNNANALLQAGTLQQQTQQKGMDALYNQFLMKQQYPFQVAQFLASTAAGLGPGYGGTSFGFQNQYQPLSAMGNPLSDPRLKTGAGDDEPEVIGQTNDGQDIYRYRLMDPDTGRLGPPQIGLMADEVEERRPDAIGDYKGFRTVDYKKATDDAARMGGGVMGRGDYAEGGLVSIVPQDFKMPTARLDSPSLQFQRPEPKQKYGLGEMAKDALGLIDTGKGLYKEGSGIFDSLEKSNLAPKLGLGIFGNSVSGAASGGSIMGGKPDDVEMTQGPQAAPMPTAHLDAPELSFGSSQQQKSGGLGDMIKGAAGLAGTAKTLFDIGSTVGPALMAFSDPRLKTGVRSGYARGGGGLSADSLFDYLVKEKGADPREAAILTSGAGVESSFNPSAVHDKGTGYGLWGHRLDRYDAMKRFTGEDRPEWRKQADFALDEFRHRPEHKMAMASDDPATLTRAQMFYERPAGFTEKHPEGGKYWDRRLALTQQLMSGDRSGGLAPMAYAAKEDGPSFPPTKIDYEPTGTVAKGGLQPAEAPEGLSGFLRGKPASGLGEKALDFATSERFIVPLLTGLGAMAGSGSRFLAPAILQGLGAGAQSYMQIPKLQAETQKARAEALTQEAEARARNEMAPKIHAETQKQLIENFKSSFAQTPYGNFVFLENGVPITQAEYMEMARQGKAPKTLGYVPKDANQLVTQAGANGAPGGSDASPATPIDIKQPEPQKVEVPNDIYDKGSIDTARKEQRIAMNGGPLAEDAKKRTEQYSTYVTGEVTGARENAPYVKELSTTLADAYARHGFDEPGFKANLRSEVSSFANTLYHALGGDPDVDLTKLKESKDIVGKISTLLATQRSAAGGQHAYAALEAIKGAIPNLEMNNNAGAELTAQLMSLQQRAVDRDAHMRAYLKDSGGLGGDAADDFTKKSASRYQMEQKILKDLMLHAPDALKVMMSGQASPEQIEAFIKKSYGQKSPSGMWRYFSPSR